MHAGFKTLGGPSCTNSHNISIEVVYSSMGAEVRVSGWLCGRVLCWVLQVLGCAVWVADGATLAWGGAAVLGVEGET